MFAGEWNTLSQPNSRVVGPCGVLMGGQDGSNNLPSPTAIANGAAWYDLSDTTSLIKDGSDRIQLISDKSGLSVDNALVLPGVAGNYASFPALTAFGTSDFSISAQITVATLADQMSIFGGNIYSFAIRKNTSSGTLSALKTGVVAQAASTGAIVAFTQAVVGYTRSGTTGTYYIDGVAAGTTIDSQNYTVGITEIGSQVAGAGALLDGNIKWARVYSTALDATAMAADAAGTVQANNTFNMDFGLAAKAATSVTATTGQTVTINQTSIALPARIHGARDLYQGLSASQPTYLGWSGANYGYLNEVSGNYFSTTKYSPLAGEVMRVEVDTILPSLRPASNVYYTGVFTGASDRSWAVGVTATTGTARVLVSSNGTSATTEAITSTVAIPLDTRYVAYAIDGTGGTVDFETSTDGVSWSALGAQVSIVTPLTLYAGAAASLEVGAINTGGNAYAGRFYSVNIYADGTLVRSFNPADYPLSGGSTFPSSATGETWTINGGAKIVQRTGAYFDGTADYMKSAPFSLSQPKNVYFVGEQVAWVNTDSIYEGNSSSERMKLGQFGTSPNIVLGTNTSPLVSDWLIKTCAAVCALFNSASSELRVNRNAASVSDIGTDNANGFTLGAKYDANGESNIFASEILIYDTTAHTTSTQDRLALYAGRKWRFSV